MKIGYSLLLAELVSASLLDYQDCKDFQIVCPVCMEPLHKKVRHIGNDSAHFLSHYHLKDSNKECELRVEQYTSEAIKQYNHESKQQRLKDFLEFLPSLVHSQIKQFIDRGTDQYQVFNSLDINALLEESRFKTGPISFFIADACNGLKIDPGNRLHNAMNTLSQDRLKVDVITRVNIFESLFEFFKTKEGAKVAERLVITQLVIMASIHKFYKVEEPEQYKLMDDEGFMEFTIQAIFGSPLKIKLAIEKARRHDKYRFFTTRLGINVLQSIMNDETIEILKAKLAERVKVQPQVI
jgi:hypothetical protein